MPVILEDHFNSFEEAVTAFIEDLTKSLNVAISERGNALLAVSGGRTPQTVFRILREKVIDWSRVTITLTDERWVPNNHADSNENLVNTFLRREKATEVKFIPLFGGEKTPQEGQSACEERLRKLSLPFDAVYLGMGDDGHFASLFPHTNALNEREQLCVPVPAEGSRLARMSLSTEALFNTRKIYLLYSGESKYRMYCKAKETGSYHDIPLRLLLTQEKSPVRVFRAL